jgi:thymidine kinase
MFSGKSEELMRRIIRAEIANQAVVVFKPSVDDRYHENNVVSHTGRSIPAYSVHNPKDILRLSANAEVVGIDEVQFFPGSIVSIIQDLVREGKRVIVSGLDQDFRGEPFGVMPELLARAEFVDKLQAICVACGGIGTRTQRIVDGKPARWDSPLVLVGAQEAYEARCRSCHTVPRDLDKPEG